jgi:hypothetical protein
MANQTTTDSTITVATTTTTTITTANGQLQPPDGYPAIKKILRQI